ncbi:MAG TPA: type II secretion system protein [Terriglobales bacterium]|nr:type II secretion system protein [Terriglobales bacterium]
MKLHPNLRRKANGSRQQGYVLVVMLLFLAIMAIGLTAMAPAMAQRIRRDREIEMIHRGRQYARAIRLFYRKFGRYPMRLEELENTNNIRFLRRRYKDPMVPSGEWHLIHYGEVQSLGGNAPLLPGTGVPGAPGATGSGSSASPFANTFSSVAQTTPGQTGASIGQGGTTTSASSTSTGQGGTTTGQSGTGASADSSQSSGTPGQPTPVSQLSSPLGGTSPVFGGGPVLGVSSTSKKESIKILDKKNHYNEWQFVYDPTLDMTAGIPVAGTTGQPTQGLPGAQISPGIQTGATSPGTTSPVVTSPGMPGTTTPAQQ